jgi:uncharacterized protein (UPF0333 family)
MSPFFKTSRFAALLAVMLVVGVAGIASGAAGSYMIIGNSDNNSGKKQTQLTANADGNAFKLLNNGAGAGLRGVATGGGNGMSANSTTNTGNGLKADNTSSSDGGVAAIWAEGNQQRGIYGNTFNEFEGGVIGDDLSQGVNGTGSWGITDYGAGTAGFAFNDTTGTGVGNGGWFANLTSEDYALNVVPCDFAPGAGDCPSAPLAAHFQGDVTIDGTCTGCAAANLAVNGTTRTIQQGDALTLTGVKTDGASKQLLMLVAPAHAGQQVVGVAAYAMVPRTVFERAVAAERGSVPKTTSIKRTIYVHDSSTTIKPGQVMLVITHGLFSFSSVDASAGAVHAGDALAAGATSGSLAHQRTIKIAGQSFYAPGTSVGYALGSVTSGSKVIAIFVSPH